MRSRCRLHRTKLEDFKQWCASKGLPYEENPAIYQVLKIQIPGQKHPSIIYDRDSGDHFTTFGNSEKLVQQFLSDKRKAA